MVAWRRRLRLGCQRRLLRGRIRLRLGMQRRIGNSPLRRRLLHPIEASHSAQRRRRLSRRRRRGAWLGRRRAFVLGWDDRALARPAIVTFQVLPTCRSVLGKRSIVLGGLMSVVRHVTSAAGLGPVLIRRTRDILARSHHVPQAKVLRLNHRERSDIRSSQHVSTRHCSHVGWTRAGTDVHYFA